MTLWVSQDTPWHRVPQKHFGQCRLLGGTGTCWLPGLIHMVVPKTRCRDLVLTPNPGTTGATRCWGGKGPRAGVKPRQTLTLPAQGRSHATALLAVLPGANRCAWGKIHVPSEPALGPLGAVGAQRPWVPGCCQWG